MRLKILSIPLLSIALLGADAWSFEANRLNTCHLSKPAKNNYEPSSFAPSNNLLRLAGMQEIYCGEKILLKIKLLDEDCVPISDAKIYIWQVGCDGKYPYKPLKNKVNEELINTGSRSSFVGHGTSTSDNVGNSNFITIYPPSKHDQNFINVRITHSYYGEFQTQIKMSRDIVIRTKDYNIVESTITLPWKNIRKSY
jgi:protocatechuate 3,4-dioxygenase, beta subunit